MKRAFICAVLCSWGLGAWGEDPGTVRPQIRIERVPVDTGAELVTILARGASGDEVPMVSILRDTLGNPETERLRNVWVLTYARPGILQHVAAALPFYYTSAGSRKVNPNRPPASLMDLSAPEKVTWEGLAGTLLQTELLDGEGLFWRAPTRGYRSNATEYRNMHASEALQILSEMTPETEGADTLTKAEWDEIEGRLALSRRLFGGLVSDAHVARETDRQTRELQINRGHNWELLRQTAESSGLYFEPLFFGESTPGYALLWVARKDLEEGGKHSYDGQFLKVSNPWTDPSLKNWKGYEETWDAGTMIPLALYGLSYPPAPLLMVDFRDQWKPKRREMIARAADYTAVGILGFTGWGNWGYMAGKISWNWFRHRHGTNVDRMTRVSAYAELEHDLFFDDRIDPKFRGEIEKRVGHLAMNPFERSEKDEIAVARQQYAALVRYAQNPKGLKALLARDRGSEAAKMMETPGQRVGYTAATVATLGIYRHREAVTPEVLSELERKRRLNEDVRYLRKVVASSPQIEIAYDRGDVVKHLDDLADLHPTDKELHGAVAALVAKVFAQTRDDETKRRCLACLSRMNTVESKRELQRLGGNTIAAASE